MTNSIAILGAAGYTGAELLRILSGHQACEISVLAGASSAGKVISELYPSLQRIDAPPIERLEDAIERVNSCDVCFSCLPHGESMSVLPSLTSGLVIDLGSDFRLQDPDLYPNWYGRAHSCPEELPGWVYGLPELFRSAIQQSTRIANPGCYPTAISLALAPLLKENVLLKDVVVNAVSGTSGAGRAAKPDFHYSHLHESLFAYKPGRHQHTPEIEMALRNYSGREITISFTPHVGPYVRGIYATCSAPLITALSDDALLQLLQNFYRDEPFVSVSPTPPTLKSVRGSNSCILSGAVDRRSNRVILTSVIDNLTKGASGQAVQNMNICLGIDETTGLSQIGLYP